MHDSITTKASYICLFLYKKMQYSGKETMGDGSTYAHLDQE
jgi:hypothetical protein